MKLKSIIRLVLPAVLILLAPFCTRAQSDTTLLTAQIKLIDRANATGSDSGNYYAQQGLLYFISKQYLPGQAAMVMAMAMSDIEEGRHEQAKIRGLYALDIYRQVSSLKDVVLTQNFVGSIEASRGHFAAAQEYFNDALELHDTIPSDNAGLMLTYMNMGKLYLQNKDSASSARYFLLAESVSRKIPVNDTTITLYNYIAQLYISRGDDRKALRYLENNIELTKKPEMMHAHAQSQFALGQYYCERGDASKALDCWNRALGAAAQQRMYALEVNILLNVSEIVLPEYANDYLDEAMTICNKMHNPMTRARLYGEMALMYERQGKFMNALYASKKQIKIIDSLEEINRDKEFKTKGTARMLEKSKSRVRQLETLNHKNAIQGTIIAVISILLIIALGIMIYMYSRTTKLNAKLVRHEKELNDLNTMKNKLFSIIGHDLRAPLGKIYTVLDMYDDDVFTEEEKREILSDLKEHTKATSETLDKLLYWGQSLLKGITLQQISFLTKQYITQNIELKKTAAIDKNITIADTTPEHLKVYADSTQFDFVLRNLLANAIKFTYENGRIEINSDEQAKDGFVVFSVKDNGTGMEPERLKNIFVPFNSKDGTANEKGTGMGLMLCKEFVIKNGGDLWAESEQGKGTTFYFSVRKAE